MDWTERMNAAAAYIEANLEGEIEHERLAQIAGCSSYNFQRLFVFVVGKPLAQYIRERRLTLAAFDVVRSEARLIDIALRYGYDAQDAFTRAFRAFHGVAPSTARREPVSLKSCPRIAFEKPKKEARAMEYRIEKWPAFTVFGFRETIQSDEVFQAVPGLWERAWQNGRMDVLFDLLKKTDYRPEGLLGVIQGGRCAAEEAMWYYQGVTAWVDAPDVARTERPEGLRALEIPRATWVILEANGDPRTAVPPVHRQFYTQWLPASGYALADLPVLESYMTDHRQRVWIAVEEGPGRQGVDGGCDNA